MNPVVILQDPARGREGTVLANTNATAVLAPEAQQVLIVDSVTVTNPTGGDVNVTVAWFDGTTSYTLWPARSLEAGGWFSLTDIALPLNEDEELRVTGANGVHVMVATKDIVGNQR